MVEITIVRVCDVLNQANKTEQDITDDLVFAECPSCGNIPLTDCLVSMKGAVTVYTHPKCGNTIAVIGAPEPSGEPWPGRGYRLGDFVIRNAAKLTVETFGSPLIFDASPNALAKTRDN